MDVFPQIGRGSTRRLFLERATIGVGLLLAGGALVGCTDPPTGPVFPRLGFSHRPPFLFRAGRVEEVRSEFSRTNAPPNVEHLMPLAPDRAAGQWAADRLQANGEGDAAVRFTVHEASVVEKTLRVERGVGGLVKDEQAVSYYAQLEASVDLVDALTGVVLGSATAKVWRGQTLPESATANERDSLWFDLVEALMTAFDKTMSARIHEHLGDALVGGESL